MSSSFEGVYEAGIIDPGTPVLNSTRSFWQSEPHRFANLQSAWPTTNDIADVIIIGSGITGSTLARSLITQSPGIKVILVEARALCSGATGRNGGHIKTMTYAVWEHRKQHFGIEEAIRLTSFEHSHLRAMTDLIRHENINCDLLDTEGLDTYYDVPTFMKALSALDDMRMHVPGIAREYKVYKSKNVLCGKFKLSNRCVGAIGIPAASLWPYKMVMGLLESIIQSGRLNVQSHTTVQGIEEEAGFAVVKTSRGHLNARKVVHCTNGWLGHLLPELRPYISPVRGNVVRYEAGPKGISILGLDSQYSLWLRYAEKDYDYLIQRKSGDVVVGRANTGRRATGDDSETDLSPQAHLRGFAHEVTASPDLPLTATGISHAWSGILAFTQDSMPFVGQLPDRKHQWVCGGYHGIGMIKAFRTAHMAALMVLGEQLSNEYPESYLLTEKRLQKLRKSLLYNNIQAKL